MTKKLLKSMVALAAMFGFGTMNMAAQEEDLPVLPVKMTYVGANTSYIVFSPDSITGQRDTIAAGYNKVPEVGGTVKWGREDWNANWIGYLQVDATALPGIITKATLKAKVSGSTDSKRGTSWGLALTDNAWSDQLSYNITKDWTVTKLLNNGNLVNNSQKSATVFEEVSFDITEALSGADFTGFATIIVFETAAAGGYMTEAYVEVEYDPFEATATKFDFEDGNVVFSNGTNSGEGRVTTAIEFDATLNSNVLGWTCSDKAQNGYSFSYFNFTNLLNNPALVKVEFDYYNTKGARSIMTIGDALVRGTDGTCSKVTYSKNGAIFRIGSDKNNAFINDIIIPQEDKVTTTPIIDEETGEEIGSESSTEPGLCDKWLHVALVVNNDAKTVNWVVTDIAGELINSGSSAFYSGDALECTQIDMFGYINKSHCAMIDNLEITNYKSNAVFADYTVKYVDAEGNELKASRTGNGQVGKLVSLLDSDKVSIYAEDNSMKYIYVSDDSETTPIAEEGTVITVTFRNAEIWNAVLNCMIEGTSGTANRLAQFMGTFFEGDNYYVYPARGYGKNDKYYFTPATSWNGATFTFPGSVAPATQAGKKYYIGTLYYSPVDSVAYYSDFERLALPTVDEGEGTGLGQLEGTVNNWWSFSNGIFDRFSQGRGIRLDIGSYVWTEPIAEAGTYMVTIYGRNDKSAACEEPYALGLIQEDGSVKLYADIAAPTWGSATTGTSIIGSVEKDEEGNIVSGTGVAIPAGGKLAIVNTGNGDMISLDDISLTKVADYTEQELITVGIDLTPAMQPVNGIVYNLNGQAVKNATKGIYVLNGKKFLVK